MLRAVEAHLAFRARLEIFVKALVVIRAWTPRTEYEMTSIPADRAMFLIHNLWLFLSLRLC